MQAETEGVSPKLKAALLVALGVAAPILTVLAAVWPDVFTAPVIAAISSVVTGVAAAFGVYRGSPGTVVGTTAVEDMPQSAPLNIHADPDATS